MQKILVSFNDARSLIQDADVLLFRGSSYVSSLLKWAGRGSYSHVELAGWNGEYLESCGYKEMATARCTSVRHAVNTQPGLIDVYRISHAISVPVYNQVEKKVDNIKFVLTADVKQRIIGEMRELTGNSYSWRTIWNLAKYHIPLLRFFSRVSLDDKCDNPAKLAMVCSTSVAFCIRKHFTDLIPNLSDWQVAPSDLARSPLLSYLFTLVP